MGGGVGPRGSVKYVHVVCMGMARAVLEGCALGLRTRLRGSGAVAEDAARGAQGISMIALGSLPRAELRQRAAEMRALVAMLGDFARDEDGNAPTELLDKLLKATGGVGVEGPTKRMLGQMKVYAACLTDRVGAREP